MTLHHDTNTSPGTMPGIPGGYAGTTTNVGVFAGSINPRDRIHWPAIWGGLFASLATLLILGVLGTAVGLSIWDRGQAEAIGWGLGIWMIISAIAAFFVGGWLAGRSAAVAGGGNGALNGAMVWALALGLMLLLGGAGLSNLVGVNIAGDPRAAEPHFTEFDRAQPAGAQFDEARTAIDREPMARDPGFTVEATRGDAATAAWWTLVALLVGLGCSALGGWFGVSKYESYRDRYASGRTGGTPPSHTDRPAT